MKTNAAFLAITLFSLVIAGCAQLGAPTPTATPTPTAVAATPVPTQQPTATAPGKSCVSSFDCKLAAAQIARYCNGTDNNAWSSETRFECKAGYCSDQEYKTVYRVADECQQGCINGFCNEPEPTPSPTPMSYQDQQTLRINRLAQKLAQAASQALNEPVTMQGDADFGFSYYSTGYQDHQVSITLAKYAYNTYAPPGTYGYNSYNITDGNVTKEVDLVQTPGVCRKSDTQNCYQKLRMQCYNYAFLATITSTEAPSSINDPKYYATTIARLFLASCPNEFDAP
ncbi:MAG TPA: hypothetical protein VGQ00_04685 [Candidatus Norongarragalinales archaeon]|jgi:hypothetical protein|nr:hypothetical protein [Candidatus Norongarragalinales archaeon]